MKKNKLLSLFVVIILFAITGCGNSKYEALKGKWKASIDNQNVYNDETIGGKEDYFLELDEDGSYELTTKSSDLANGRYTISNKNVITFFDEGREILGICKFNNNELDCSEKSYYAFKYIKID